jgi:hypothetical protein
MPKRFRAQLTSERDIAMMVFLWKWKVASPLLLMKKFFPNASGHTAYKRLWTLHRGGFIDTVVDRTGTKFLWTLSKLGAQVAKEHFRVASVEDGFKSESPGHDLLVMALQLGDLALSPDKKIVTFSEQQLRRYEPSDYPQFVPRKTIHRPDGYTYLANSSQTIATEVELHVKSKSAYIQTEYMYATTNVNQVLWLVPTQSAARSITSHLSQNHNGPSESKHSFILLQEFMTKGWGAKILSGKSQGQDIQTIMGTKPTNSLQTSPKPVCTSLSLNVSKSPHKAATCKFYELGNFSN